jgi:hypothetical protein
MGNRVGGVRAPLRSLVDDDKHYTFKNLAECSSELAENVHAPLSHQRKRESLHFLPPTTTYLIFGLRN